jgi:hypothetical protein
MSTARSVEFATGDERTPKLDSSGRTFGACCTSETSTAVRDREVGNLYLGSLSSVNEGKQCAQKCARRAPIAFWSRGRRG